MVNFCAVVGCSNRADKHKGIGFYRLPAIISHQGSQTYELTCKRRDLWLSRLHRDDLVPYTIIHTYIDCERSSRLCGARSGSPQLIFISEWMESAI